MEPETRNSSELVISMTLAELFLLILFVVWYGVKPPPPPPPPRPEAALRAEIVKLERETSRLQTDLADRERRLEYWRRTFNRDLPGSDPEVWEAFLEYLDSHPEKAKTLVAYLGRDNPPCLPEPRGNTLLYVEVIDGRTQVEVLREPVKLNETLRASGVAPIIKGQVVTDPDRIDALLAASTKSTILRNGKAVACRFDYSLTYGSDEDYRRARTKFEKYLYPARLTLAAR